MRLRKYINKYINKDGAMKENTNIKNLRNEIDECAGMSRTSEIMSSLNLSGILTDARIVRKLSVLEVSGRTRPRIADCTSHVG